MSFSKKHINRRFVAPTIGLGFLICPLFTAGDTVSTNRLSLDCGQNSLFILLRLSGLEVSVDRLKSTLPPQHPSGYSMTELISAAEASGLGLEGVRFDKGDRPLDRPAIMYLADGGGGHFAVIRPVGTTGTMVQVIDPPYAPRIVDTSRLFESGTWTGRVLIARDPWPSRNRSTLGAAIGGFAVLAAGMGLWSRRRGRDS